MFKNNSAAVALCLCVFASGGFAQDLQTLADNAAKSPDKVLKLSGEYYLSKPLELTRAHSGLIIDGQGKTLISGGVKVSGWTKDGNLWKAKVDAKKVEALFVNGKRANVASDGKYRFMYADFADSDPNVFLGANEDLKQLEGLTDAELSRVYFDLYFVWCNIHSKFVSLTKNKDGASSTVRTISPTAVSLFKWEIAPRYIICNVRSQLDEKGEYYFDAETKTLFYIPRDGEDMASAEAYYPVLDCVLNAKGESRKKPLENVKIAGVKFAHGGHFPPEGYRQSMQAASSNEALVRFNYAKNITFTDNKVEHTNIYGLDMKNGVDGALVENCEFFDCGSGGIKIGPMRDLPESESTFRVVVRNNIIWQYGRYNKAGVGVIIFDSGENTIEKNTIFDGYYTGISVGWTWGFAKTKSQNNKIADNRIFKIGHGVLCDMGGIYTLGDAAGSVISGNEISEVRRHRYGGWGIYNDEGSANYVVSRNYVYNTEEDPYFQHYGKNNLVKNNVFKYGEVSQVGVGRMSKEYPDELVYTNNIVVYKSPAILLRKNVPITTYTAKFSKNLYWNESGDVKFAGMSLAEWQKRENQDEGSVIANPKLDGYTPTNEVYKKIGFEPFEINAGVSGEMKTRLDKILSGYKFPDIVKIPLTPPWGFPYSENLSRSLIGGKPLAGKIRSSNKGFDVVVLKEDDGRFIRFWDSKDNDPQYLPMITYNIGTDENQPARLAFEIRVNSRSTFFVECRGDTGFKGPSVDVSNGKLVINGKNIDLPYRKWLKVELVFKTGSDKSYTVKVSNGPREIVNETVKEYRAPAMKNATSLIISQTSNEDDCYFDIRKVSFSPIR